MDIKMMLESAVAVALVPGAFWAAGKFGPSYLMGKAHGLFEEIKESDWVRDPAHPKRAAWVKATLELAEEEIPNPGQGQELYDAFGNWLAPKVKLGSAATWSKLGRQFGDALDTEVAEDIKELAALAQPPGGTPS